MEESQTALQAKSDEAGDGDSATGPDVCSFPQDSLFGGGGSYTHDYFFVPTMWFYRVSWGLQLIMINYYIIGDNSFRTNYNNETTVTDAQKSNVSCECR